MRSSARAPDVPLVVDPVMIASSRRAAARSARRRCAEAPPDRARRDRHAQRARGRGADRRARRRSRRHAPRRRSACCASGAKAAMVKGGHLPGEILRDLVVSASGEASCSRRRGSRRATPTAPAARSLRRSPPGWRRAWRLTARGRARARLRPGSDPHRAGPGARPRAAQSRLDARGLSARRVGPRFD